MEYKVLSNDNMNELIKEVNEHLLKGWKPQGGVCVLGFGYYQAIVK
ncbi:hypothetical protein CMT92_07345 [Elizabethkingia anophelis]|nr:DUF1737 domain-containing protein [Elizabethkingia anophelis]MCT3871770.1 DUF1737 domain-containing protein [Elizabethkingia anophelis]MDV3847466.1 hypothetical protein [Elizabethkingia anophelis]